MFFLVRKYLLREISPEYHFAADAAFLAGSALMIAAFWTGLYALLGEYNDIFRKSRLGEVIRLGQVSFLGAIIIFFVLLLDDQGRAELPELLQNHFGLLPAAFQPDGGPAGSGP